MEDSFELVENERSEVNKCFTLHNQPQLEKQEQWTKELSLLSSQGFNNRILLTNLLEQLGSVEGVLDFLQKSPSNTNSTVEQEEREEGSPSLTPALLDPLSIDDYFGPHRETRVLFKRDNISEHKYESDNEQDNGDEIPQPRQINLEYSNDSTEHDIAPPLLSCLSKFSPTRPTKRFSFNAGPSSPDGLSVSAFLASPLQDLVKEPSFARRNSLPSSFYSEGKMQTLISEHHFGSPKISRPFVFDAGRAPSESDEEKENMPSDSGVNLLLDSSSLLKDTPLKKIEEMKNVLQEVVPENTAIDISGTKIAADDAELIASLSGDSVDIKPQIGRILAVMKPENISILPSAPKPIFSPPKSLKTTPSVKIVTTKSDLVFCYINVTDLVFAMILTTILFWSYREGMHRLRSSFNRCEDLVQSNRHTNVNLVD